MSERRIFLLSGWRRWLAAHAVSEHERQQTIIKERPRRNWAVLVADDCAALEYQRLEYRIQRASGRASGNQLDRYRARAHLAAQVRRDVKLYLRPGGGPGGDDGILWDCWIDWWKAPVQCYAHQDPDDGGWSMS